MNLIITFAVALGCIVLLALGKALELSGRNVPWARLRGQLDMLLAKGADHFVVFVDTHVYQGAQKALAHAYRGTYRFLVKGRNSVEEALITMLRKLQRRRQMRHTGTASSFLQHVGEHKSNLRNRL